MLADVFLLAVRFRRPILLAYYAFLVLILTIPIPAGVPGTGAGGTPGHFFLFFSLMLLLGFDRLFKLDRKTLAYGVVSAFVLESIQFAVPWREFDFADIGVNLAAVISCYVLLKVFFRKANRKKMVKKS